jgi:hypothetical protein
MVSPNYFISIDLKYQLQILLEIELAQNSLLKNLNEIKLDRIDGYINNIFDGQLYKQMIGHMKNPNVIVLTYIFYIIPMEHRYFKVQNELFGQFLLF